MATAPARGRALPAAADAAAETTRALYERYSRQIFAYCLVQLRNREEAEDAVQSTFLNAFRGLERGVVPELESAWLYKIAQHVCLTRQRSWSRRRLVESPQELEAATELLGAPAHDAEPIADLTEALRELPEQQRRAILLREWQGLTYKEIAEELQVSQASVETLIFRARRGLARSLEKLRAMTDLGSVAAALKTFLLGGGTKVAATLVTVATTSVVAATPAARHGVVHLVDAVAGTAPPATTAHRAVPKPAPRPTPIVAAPKPTPEKRHAPPRQTSPTPAVVRATTKAVVEHTPTPAPAVRPRPAPRPIAEATPAPPPAPPTTTTTPTPTVETPTVPVVVTKTPAPTPAPVPPSISGFTPGSGASGTVVQVIGKAFTGATSVRFNGTSADFTVTSDGQVTTRVPTAATSGPITIATPNGTVTSDGSFTVATTATTSTTTTTPTPPPAAPSVSGVSPSSGAPGTIVQVAGAHLTGATAVRFGDASADFTVVSDTQITAKVPTSAVSGPVTVVTPQGTASSGTFTVTGAGPTIDGFTPRIGPIGSSVILVGHNVTGATAVSLNGTAAAFKVDSDTQLTFVVPPGATSGPVSVTTPNGTVTSSTSFTVGTPPPEISGFSPASGAAGASVGIGGARFTGASSVKFNGVAASFTVSSDGLIMAVVPAGATSGPVTVTTPAGTATSSTSFTVTH